MLYYLLLLANKHKWLFYLADKYPQFSSADHAMCLSLISQEKSRENRAWLRFKVKAKHECCFVLLVMAASAGDEWDRDLILANFQVF